MGVARAVGGADLGARDGAAKQHGVDLVGARGAALVEREDDERAVDVELGVGEQRGQPVARPFAGDGDGRVVGVVGCFEKLSVSAWLPSRIGNLLMLGVINIHCGSLLAASSLSNMVRFLHLASRFTSEVTESKLITGLPGCPVSGSALFTLFPEKQNSLVLANIVGLARLLVDPVALKPGVGLVLAVDTPAHALGLQEVHDGLGAGANATEAVVSDAEGVGTDRSDIVGLASQLAHVACVTEG